MKKIITITALVLAFGFVFTNAYAGGGMSKDRFRSFETSKLIGTEVENSLGESVGTIQDFILDSNGHVDFVILSHHFYWEYVPVPSQTVAVPFSAIQIKSKEKIAALKFSGWKLDFAPQFAMNDLTNRKWAENVHKYYGLQPYWTEGAYPRRMNSTMNKPMSEQKVNIWGYRPNSESFMGGWRW